MGLVIDTEASAAAGHAARATRESRTVFLYRQHVPASVAGQPDPVGDLAEVIEAIESQGWALAQLAYDERKSRAGGVLLLFRPSRARTPAGDGYDAHYRDSPSGRVYRWRR
jgi:hypothetical protein